MKIKNAYIWSSTGVIRSAIGEGMITVILVGPYLLTGAPYMLEFWIEIGKRSYLLTVVGSSVQLFSSVIWRSWTLWGPRGSSYWPLHAGMRASKSFHYHTVEPCSSWSQRKENLKTSHWWRQTQYSCHIMLVHHDTAYITWSVVHQNRIRYRFFKHLVLYSGQKIQLIPEQNQFWWRYHQFDPKQ